jgi:serine/threonine protein kinase
MYKYKLDQKIGSGAFGDVFIAHHIETNERLAIKLMKQTYHDWN